MPTNKLLLDPLLRVGMHLRSSGLSKYVRNSAYALLSSAPTGGKHILPSLNYDYNALEPIISSETMMLHHTKHHNAYVTNLNTALQQLDAAVSHNNISTIISLQNAIKFNGGGHLNHILFWDNLTQPDSSSLTSDGPLIKAIESKFCSFDNMKQKLIQQTVAIQGSGWGWLGYNSKSKQLDIATTANQDPLQATTGLIPLLGIDVWEHAYYVDYRNVRPDYVNNVINRIVNWTVVEQRWKDAHES